MRNFEGLKLKRNEEAAVREATRTLKERFPVKELILRHEGDYQPLRVFQAEEVTLYLEQCAGFIARMETLLGRKDLSPTEYSHGEVG